MDLHSLAQCLEAPETLQQLLGDYSGDCSVGLGQDPHSPPGHWAVIVQVLPGATLPAPSHIRLGTATLPVIVQHNHTSVQPLQH